MFYYNNSAYLLALINKVDINRRLMYLYKLLKRNKSTKVSFNSFIYLYGLSNYNNSAQLKRLLLDITYRKDYCITY
jgi:hypothetical protein